MGLLSVGLLLGRRKALLIHIRAGIYVGRVFLYWHQLERFYLAVRFEGGLFGGGGGNTLEAKGALGLAGERVGLWIEAGV